MSNTSGSPTPKPLSSVLVANRGEIARRVFRSARAMGLRCVAVYVDADADAPFVREADVAVRLHDGYLNGSAIIAAAVATGANAIHPGYGFLSENAPFAQAVSDAGLVWVGPDPGVIETMGDKLAAKRAAVEAGVPTLPSAEDPDDDNDVGYPLLVKASAGGGGKGMRVVHDPADLPDAVAAARREALSGFGDDTVFLERYVPRSRHVEIQLLGDTHGGLVHLGERECSIQRRHQKIIEESPSPVVDESMRAAMGDAALALGRAIGYASAGTVEFLVDDETQNFYFLEVNTRLQVEQPVTEEVTGIDLVREQLRVAAAHRLEFSQDDVTCDGHAIEARLYAADPANDFLPAIGMLDAYEPAAEPTVRWDSGVESGSRIGVEFDPMLAKVTAHAPTRLEAASRLALALERLHLGGVVTNRDFLASTLRTTAFAAGDTTTDFIERVEPATTIDLDSPQLQGVAIAAALWLQGDNHATARVLGSLPSGFRVGRLPPQRVELDGHGRTVTVCYERRRDDSFAVESWLDGGDVAGSTARVLEWTPRSIDLDVNGLRTKARVTRAGDALRVQAPRGTASFTIKPRFELPGSDITDDGVSAPMPGVVLEVRCAPGDTVTAGQTLIVLEAMKMEHHMNAPHDGVVGAVHVVAGSQVDNGQVLVVFDDESIAANADS